jgi:preprotein translocase subunit Sec63
MNDTSTIPEPKARDYYHDLGIDHFANDNQIGAAFRQLAKKWHPDRIAGINPVDAVEFRRVCTVTISNITLPCIRVYTNIID